MRFRRVLDVGRKGAGERLGALHQDAQLAGRFLVPLGLRLPGVPVAAQLVGEALDAGDPLGAGALTSPAASFC